MELTRIQQLAGVVTEDNIMINEAAIIPEDSSIEQITLMLDAARRGLGLANQLRDPIAKKKHIRAVFINLNKIRAALARQLQDSAYA